MLSATKTKMGTKWAVFVLFATLIHCSAPAKILLFLPALSKSNVIFYNNLADILTDAGHETWVYMAKVMKESHLNLTQYSQTRKSKPFIVPALDGSQWEAMEHQMHTLIFTDYSFFSKESNENFELFTGVFKDACEAQMTNKEALSELKAQNFDMAIGHHYHLCWLGITHMLGIEPVIWATSAAFSPLVNMAAGLPPAESFVPGMLTMYGDKMTFYERSMNFLGSSLGGLMLPKFYNHLNAVFQKHVGPDFPDLIELVGKKTQLYMANSIEMLEFPAPMFPNFVHIGGIGLKRGRPLNEARSGVIFVSFGSVASAELMPDGWKETIIKTAQQMPTYTFIWKYESRDIFAHEKTSAFVTHGGQNSLVEAAVCGVPVLMVPLFGDQFHNAALAAKRHRIGQIVAEKAHMSQPDTFMKQLKSVVTEKSYRSNAQRLSKMLLQQPQKPEVTAVQWVNFLAEFKTLEVFQSSSKDLNFFQLHSLDVVAVILGILHIVAIFMFLLIKKCCSYVKAGSKRKVE